MTEKELVESMRSKFTKMKQKNSLQRGYICFLEREVSRLGGNPSKCKREFLDSYMTIGEDDLGLRVKTIRFDAYNGMFQRDVYFTDEEDLIRKIEEIYAANKAAGNIITYHTEI